MKRLTLGLGAILILLAGVVISASAGSPYTFDGAPPAPAPYSDPHLDVQVHSRDQSTWYSLEGMTAQHGTDCSAPPATHVETGSYADAVFQCKDHVMTSINAGGYGEIMLTPDTLADFSAGTATVTWDVSTFRSAPTRDWFDVWISPWTENLALPLEEFYPDLQGPPKDAVHVVLNSGDTLCQHVYRNQQEIWPDNFSSGCQWWNNYDQILTQSATVRTTFKIDISKTHLRVSIPAQASTNQQEMVFFDGDIPGGLPFSQGVVQFGHHSYNPTKDGGQPGTWHWDNLTISPGVPFTMAKPTTSNGQRYLDTNGQTLTTGAGMLRFAAICKVAIDGVVQTPQIPTTHTDHFNSYFVPVSAGTHTFTFQQEGYAPGCMATGFNVWSLTAQSDTPTPAPTTATVTPTNTVAPTSTPSVAPTSTPTVKPPTPTPTPAKYRCQRRNANGSWTTVWTKVGGGSCP